LIREHPEDLGASFALAATTCRLMGFNQTVAKFCITGIKLLKNCATLALSALGKLNCGVATIR